MMMLRIWPARPICDGQHAWRIVDDFLSDIETTVIGERNGDASGQTVAGIGDVNQDGRDDVLSALSVMMTSRRMLERCIFC